MPASFLTFQRNQKKGGQLPNEPCFAGSDLLNASSPMASPTWDGWKDKPCLHLWVLNSLTSVPLELPTQQSSSSIKSRIHVVCSSGHIRHFKVCDPNEKPESREMGCISCQLPHNKLPQNLAVLKQCSFTILQFLWVRNLGMT